jgi:hypothetical protein
MFSTAAQFLDGQCRPQLHRAATLYQEIYLVQNPGERTGCLLCNSYVDGPRLRRG